MRVARAFDNMLRAAWHDPLWAITAVLLAPSMVLSVHLIEKDSAAPG
jgi:hypothetical protein